MKNQIKQIKWISTVALALVVSTGAQALNNWNIKPIIEDKEKIHLSILDCISVPKLPDAHLTTVTRSRVISEGGGYSELESYITSVTDTSITAETNKTTYSGVVASGGGLISAVAIENAITTKTFNSVTSSNYMDITEESYEASDYLYRDIHRYNAFLRMPVGSICDEQTWLSSYHHTSEITKDTGIISAIFPETTVNRIVSIDVEKIVEAGVFTTYQHTIDNGNRITTNWVHVASGILVASESRDSSTHALIATKELTEMYILGEPPVYYPPLDINLDDYLDDYLDDDYETKFKSPLPKSMFTIK